MEMDISEQLQNQILKDFQREESNHQKQGVLMMEGILEDLSMNLLRTSMELMAYRERVKKLGEEVARMETQRQWLQESLAKYRG